MKITKQNLKHIIEEELQEILGSDVKVPRYPSFYSIYDGNGRTTGQRLPTDSFLLVDDGSTFIKIDDLVASAQSGTKPEIFTIHQGQMMPMSQSPLGRMKNKYKMSEGEFATAAGMQQDIDMRGARGDFEKGDYGMHGQPGELSDYGEYPWIQDALKDLQDEDLISKQKAVQALADELGVTVRELK